MTFVFFLSPPNEFTKHFKGKSLSKKVGIFDLMHIVGIFEDKADFIPGIESSKTIELVDFIPLKAIAFK